MPLSLVAVVGPVEPDLLRAFVAHYRSLGVERFLLAFHFPPRSEVPLREELRRLSVELVGEVPLVQVGPWGEATNDRLRDELRARAGGGWHLISDVDEFQSYMESPAASIAEAEAAGSRVVEGVMLDRLAPDGSFPAWSPEVGLDATYSLGGHLTHALLDADPRKIVLARAGMPLRTGNHTSPGVLPINHPPVVVHHFKWRYGVLDYLSTRLDRDARRPLAEAGLVGAESDRLLRHVTAHGGRVDVTDPAFALCPARVGVTPDNWATRTRSIVDYWRNR